MMMMLMPMLMLAILWLGGSVFFALVDEPTGMWCSLIISNMYVAGCFIVGYLAQLWGM